MSNKPRRSSVLTDWYPLPVDGLDVGRLTTVVVEGRAICVTRTSEGYGALDNHCPHQGGPLGDGQLENGYLICPWHAYEYDPVTGTPPPGFKDAAHAYPVEQRDGALFVELPVVEHKPSLMDQMVDVMCDWGVDSCFGMVGHSNLGLADALRRAEEDGRLRYIGIRHEGAAAFAASGYAKLTGRPAACLTIAGPGATNLLTGLWDAKVDRAPVLALTGQVKSQVLGPGTFQEVPLASAFEAVTTWSQTVLRPDNATELMALAVKHAIVERGVGHLIFPDEVQEWDGLADAPARPRVGRVASNQVAPPAAELAQAVALLEGAQRPAIIVGNGARGHEDEVIAIAEHLDAPVITTFKAKGLVPDTHPLACGVLGRSGIPVASITMGRADALLVLGASFSDHTGIATYIPTIQVDLDPMTLGKFHAVNVPLLGDISVTGALLRAKTTSRRRPEQRDAIDKRWERWRTEKASRRGLSHDGALHPASLFEALSDVTPEDAVIAVDVGNNTYAFGRYFETKRGQHVLMSGYLGSIGFGLPAAMGAWCALHPPTGDASPRRVIAVCGDGGLGQYLAEVSTAAKYGMDIVIVVLDNGQLAKITKEQIGAQRAVWQTSLHNPDFAAYAELCGARGFTVDREADLAPVLREAMAWQRDPVLVNVKTDPAHS
jgi:thiamine pyrophosphate-dependent acetolactate synthase large subunit-like protein/nitrite reductase/ring-hydroxylating ferredoxin subunit